jgi:phosphoglycolate phosphatase-like HAD superfamily hydrolase
MPTKLLKSNLKSNLKAKSKALLLDVDGVIIKNRRLLSNVATNITHYSAKKLHLSPKDAIRVNKLLYSEYGHSFRGLKKACGVTCSLDNFNHEVYDTNIMSELLELRDDFQHSLHAQHLRELAVACKTKGIPIYIFSNAPFE